MLTKTRSTIGALCSSLVWDGELPPADRQAEVYDQLIAIGLRMVERREQFESLRPKWERIGRGEDWSRKHARMMEGHRAVGQATMRLLEEMQT